MFTDVYIGLVKSENFDYEKPGSPYGYSPDYALESLKVGNKPHLRGESAVYWDIVRHPNAFKTDWGCWVVRMTGDEMTAFLSSEKYAGNAFARFLIAQIEHHLDRRQTYLLTAIESPGFS